MQKIIFYTVLLILTLTSAVFAQEKTFEERAKEISKQIEAITKEEKNALKVEIDAIDLQVKEAQITYEEGKDLKMKIAEKRANNIETKVAIEEEKLNQLIQEQVDGKVKYATDSSSIRIGNKLYLTFANDTIKYKQKEYKEKRTTSQFVFAFGLNNLITEGESLEKSDFRVAGSHFYEWGLTYNTRILKNANLLHAKYGFSVMYNNLRPTDNRLFVKNGNQTELQTASVDLKESRLRNVQLVFPLHFEFDFTPKKLSKDGTKTYFRSHESFRIGLGGYGGFNLKSKQITKYELDGDKIKNKQKGNFNTTDFIYGLSAYVGYKTTSLYIKYDLNSLFKNNMIDQNNISLGLRFDFN